MNMDCAAIWWYNEVNTVIIFKLSQRGRFQLASVKTPLHSRPTQHCMYIQCVCWCQQLLHYTFSFKDLHKYIECSNCYSFNIAKTSNHLYCLSLSGD